MALTFTGLLLDVMGAILLVSGLLHRDMTVIRLAHLAMEQPRTWTQRIAFAAARRVGSRDPRATIDATAEELEQALWGLILLVTGFLFQAAGTWLSR